MEDTFFRAKNKAYSVNSCVDDKVSDSENLPQSAMLAPKGKRVRFSRTQVYYFNRQQGHSSVPQRGGCSLGMASVHFHSEVHRESAFRKMRQSEKRLNLANNFTVPSQPSGRGRRRKYRQSRVTVLPEDKNFEENINTGDDRRIPLYFSPPKLSPQRYDSTESEITQRAIIRTPSPPCLSPQKEVTNTEIPVDIPETDSENSMEAISASKTTTKKLLPLPPVVRTRLLKQAGVSNIDDSERLNCALLRNSRITVGCGCISFCKKETCSCALEGIPCQVDRPGFPCSCSDQCKNPCGRVEFSTARVRSHVLHVLQRQLANGGDRLQPVSSEHGECLQCLQERLSQLESPKSPPLVSENPPPSPPSPLHSTVFDTSIYDLPRPPLASTPPHSPPISPDGADHSILTSPLVTPISMNCAIVAASTPTSKAIVVYKPLSSLFRDCFEKNIDTEVPQQIPKAVTEDNPNENGNPLKHVPVVGGVDNIIKLRPDLQMIKDTVSGPADHDVCLQGKAIFTATSSILRPPSLPPPPKTPTMRTVKFIQTLLPGPNPDCISSLDRLSLRRRRIIRSPYPHSIRKRMALNTQLEHEREQQSTSFPAIPSPFMDSPSIQSQSPSDATTTAPQRDDSI